MKRVDRQRLGGVGKRRGVVVLVLLVQRVVTR